MTIQKQISTAALISAILAFIIVIALPEYSLFSVAGLLAFIGGTVGLVVFPIAICSIPAFIHYVIWKERLQAMELSVWAIWFFGCLTAVLTTLSRTVFA